MPIISLATFACLTGFLALFCLSMLVIQHLKKQRLVLAAENKKLNLGNLYGLLIRSGFGPFMSISERMLKVAQIRRFSHELLLICWEKNLRTSELAVLSSTLLSASCLFSLVLLLTWNILAALAVTVCAFAICVVYANSRHDKQIEQLREETPNALELISACFATGFTLLQTFQQVSKEIPGQLGALFDQSAHILETGGSTERALSALQQEARISELSFVVCALSVQHQNGGSLKQVLATASKSVKSELELKRSLRVQTAQAKLSARIVTILPFVLIAIFSLISPDFLQPFFSSIAGYALLGVAIVMQVAGIVLVQKALSVDGVA